MPPRHLALAVLAALIWGVTFLVTRAALTEVPPLLFAALRFACVAPFALIVPHPGVPWRVLALLGLLLGAGQYGFQFAGMAQGVPPGLASLLTHAQAFFTVGFAAAAFGERLRGRQLAAIGLGALGLGILLVDRSGGDIPPTALLLSVAGAVCGAAGNTLLKGLGRAVDMLGTAVWMSLAAPLPLLLLSLALEGPGRIASAAMQASWTLLGALAYSAILATIVAFAIWGRLLTTYPAASVAPFFLLVPVFGIALSVAVTGEAFGPVRLLGCGLIFAGLLLAAIPWSRRAQARPGRDRRAS